MKKVMLLISSAVLLFSCSINDPHQEGRLDVSTDKTIYKESSSLELTITLKNLSSGDLTLPVDGCGCIMHQVEKFVPDEGWVSVADRICPAVLMPPVEMTTGQRLTLELILDRRLMLVNEMPGIYRVQVATLNAPASSQYMTFIEGNQFEIVE